jgi:hypothetical protein
VSGPVYNANADVFEGAHADSAFDELVQLRCDTKLDAYADGVLRGMARVSLADAGAAGWRLYETEVALWCRGNGMQIAAWFDSQYHTTRPLAPPYSLHAALLKVEVI